jgi:hypothetical protein
MHAARRVPRSRACAAPGAIAIALIRQGIGILDGFMQRLMPNRQQARG